MNMMGNILGGTFRWSLLLGVLIVLFTSLAPQPVHAEPTLEELRKVFNCDPDVVGSTANLMREGNKKDTQRRVAAYQDVFRKMEYKSSSGCIREIIGYFDILKNILSGTLSLVATAVLSLMNWLVSYVCKFIITGINNLLASVCLPVPNLNLSMSLPSLESKSCDGISLQNVISVRGGLGGAGSLPSFSLDSAIRKMMRK